MNYGYIYKTTNLINNKIYIGQKKGNVEKSYYGSGARIRMALKKYGTINFKNEILCFAESAEQLNILEKEYIAMYRKLFPMDATYNITDGGEGRTSDPWNKGKVGVYTKEARHKMSIAKIGKPSPRKGAILTLAQKTQARTNRIGKYHSDETKRRIGEASLKAWSLRRSLMQ